MPYVQIGINHSIDHRGQLSMYLRPMGAKVPSIYGESYDARMEREARQARRLSSRYTRVREPATTRAIPPATAAMPTIGESGIISCFSVVAWIGPMSRTFSRFV